MIDRPGKWLRRFRRRPLLAAIERFRTNGGRTAIVSDYPARHKLAALQAVKLFDSVVASGEAGGPSELKPRPDGFLLAARQLQLSPADCLVIGDRHDADGEAARCAGHGISTRYLSLAATLAASSATMQRVSERMSHAPHSSGVDSGVPEARFCGSLARGRPGLSGFRLVWLASAFALYSRRPRRRLAAVHQRSHPVLRTFPASIGASIRYGLVPAGFCL